MKLALWSRMPLGRVRAEPPLSLCAAVLLAAACSHATSQQGGAADAGVETTSQPSLIWWPPFGDAGTAPICDGAPPSLDPPDAMPACDAAGAVSYQRDIEPVFGGCSGEVCHGPWTYASTVRVPSVTCCDRFLVAPGQPSKSHLLDTLEGRNLCGGVRMPLDGPALPDATLRKIAAWICQGAPNN